MCESIHLKMFHEKAVLKNLAKYTENTSNGVLFKRRPSVFFKKDPVVGVFFVNYIKFFSTSVDFMGMASYGF